MTYGKLNFPFDRTTAMPEGVQQEREIALEYLAEAWNSASEDGVDSEALAHAALFAAIATLVRDYGEEAVARMIGEIPARIDGGEYSLDRVLQ